MPRKKIGSRGFFNYSPSYQQKLIRTLKKQVNLRYDELYKKLKTKTFRNDNLFTQSKQDVQQILNILQKRSKLGVLTKEQAKTIDTTFNILNTSGYSVYQDRINELVQLEKEMSGVKVSNAMRRLLEQMTEEELQKFFNSNYYIPIRNDYDSLQLMEFLSDYMHSPQMERLLDFVDKETQIKYNTTIEKSFYNYNIYDFLQHRR